MDRKTIIKNFFYFVGVLLIVSLIKVIIKDAFGNRRASNESNNNNYVFKPKLIPTAIGSLWIPEGGSLNEQNMEVPANFKDAFSGIRYYSCVHTKSEITVFAYDFQSFKTASSVIDLKGGVDGMVSKLISNLGVSETSRSLTGSNIRCTYDGLLVGKTDTTRLLCKAAMGGTTMAIYMILAPTRKGVWQKTLFDKSSLMVPIDPIEPIGR